MRRVQEIIRGIRNVRSEYDVPAGRRIAARSAPAAMPACCAKTCRSWSCWPRLEATAVDIAAELPAPGKAATLAASGVTVYLPLAGLVDLAAERKRIQGEIDNVDKQVQRIDGLLGNPGFTDKAPANVVERERAKLVELQDRRAQLVERMAELDGN